MTGRPFISDPAFRRIARRPLLILLALALALNGWPLLPPSNCDGQTHCAAAGGMPQPIAGANAAVALLDQGEAAKSLADGAADSPASITFLLDRGHLVSRPDFAAHIARERRAHAFFPEKTGPPHA